MGLNLEPAGTAEKTSSERTEAKLAGGPTGRATEKTKKSVRVLLSISLIQAWAYGRLWWFGSWAALGSKPTLTVTSFYTLASGFFHSFLVVLLAVRFLPG